MTDTRNDTRLLAADAAGIAAAAAHLRAGKCVAFPTETVYGLGADARSDRAVAGIYAAKDRPAFNPLIVHVAGIDAAEMLAEFTADAHRLAAAFWPGPLTLVLPQRMGASLSRLVTAGLDSVGLRVPHAPVAQALLTEFGGPVAAPSANPSGRISPTTAAHVMEGLAGRISAVLDGGPCGVGVESTILDLTGQPTLLRAGGVPVETIETLLGTPLVRPGRATPDAPKAPGMLASHYAPRAVLRLDADAPGPGERFLGFGPGAQADATLSASGDLAEAAANLFACLHALDAAGSAPIAVACIPDTGLGRAINDRLRRAAAPRP